jgi:hypothetical protein
MRAWFALIGALMALGLAPAVSAQPTPGNIDTRPHPVERGDRDPRIAEDAQRTIDALKTWAERIKTLTHDKVDFNSPYDLSGLSAYGVRNPGLNVAGVLQTALNLLEAFDFIDPRENYLQPDFNPRGLPALPSHAVDDATLSPADYGEFRDLQAAINRAKNHLEKNFIVLKQTELKTHRLEELAGSAANMSGIAGAYWATSQANPNDPMNVAKARFYQTYDNGQANGLEFLDKTLKEFAEFEARVYGDRNWYLYFGLPYYNFMVARYSRPGA